MTKVMQRLNGTHDPALRSWLAAANDPGSDFPIQNLPFAIFRRAGRGEDFRAGVAIGDQILDLTAVHALGLVTDTVLQVLDACRAPCLNDLMKLGSGAVATLRGALSRLLCEGAPESAALRATLVPQGAAEYAVPARIGDFTDFYTSIHHATSIGRLFRPDNPLLPNYKWLPIAYHGRASSVCVSGQEIRRPVAQVMPAGASRPELLATRRLDYELEVGVFVGPGNPLGEAIAIGEAERHAFGLCLLNDWSARDVQAWEYQPLGPFLAKSFATTVSPWVVTLEALAPYRVPWTRDPADPQPLFYLEDESVRRRGAIDLRLEAYLDTARMRTAGMPAKRLSHSNLRDAYWTVAQMIAHHTVNGCNLEPGDLLGTGTQSGPSPEEAGSLIELTAGGSRPLELPGGETRTFLADGDRVTLRGWCERPDYARLGFGAAVGTVIAAPHPS